MRNGHGQRRKCRVRAAPILTGFRPSNPATTQHAKKRKALGSELSDPRWGRRPGREVYLGQGLATQSLDLLVYERAHLAAEVGLVDRDGTDLVTEGVLHDHSPRDVGGLKLKNGR